MDLILSFSSGIISGEGADGLGFFDIHGRYSETDGECSWTKQYRGQHAVEYRGFGEKKGIWGTWLIATPVTTKGGFHIWPLSDGPMPDLSKEEVEEVDTLTLV
jgi:hypothetical protein